MPDTVQADESSGLGFRMLARPPFNPAIRICQAAVWFRDRLLVGGGRGPLRDPRLSGSDDHRMGAGIVAGDLAGGDWRLVHDSPLDASGKSRDRSVRAFAVFRGASDDAPALYAAVGSLLGQVVLLRSQDGAVFEECGPPGLGLGDADIAAVRTLCVLGDRIYTSPVGKNRGRGWADDNVGDIPVVMGTDDPARGRWDILSPPGFADPDNESVNELVAFNGTLYAATLNRRSGFQLWRAEGLDGPAGPGWVRVLDRGAWRGPASPVPAAMAVFGGALYIGTGVQRQPGASADRFGPIAPELIRVHPDDSWDLVAGMARFTPQGLKRPASGAGPGFGNMFVQAFWRMAVHDGRLHVGGSDWRFWPTYLPAGARQRSDIPAATQDWLRQETQAWKGDYGLWSSADGTTWTSITQTGIGGNPAHYGIREMVSTPRGLVIIPAAGRGETEGGGIEIWLGERPARDESAAATPAVSPAATRGGLR